MAKEILLHLETAPRNQMDEEEESAVPVEFETLVNRLVQDEALKNSINELLRLKKAGNELDRGPKIPELSDFIESEFSRLKTEMPEQIGPKPDVEKLNQVFRFSLATVW